jgi:glycosyltransferase involved in cell wall biosynthesis
VNSTHSSSHENFQRAQKKVLHIITGLSRGGAEAMLHNLLTASNSCDIEHAVVSLTRGGVYEEKIRALGNRVHSLDMKAGIPDPRAIFRLRSIVRQFNPDLIHSWLYHAIFLTIFTKPNCPIVAGIHHSLYDIAKEKGHTRLIIRAIAMFDTRLAKLVYCSQTSRLQHEEIGYRSDSALVIPNGFDCSRFQPMAQDRMHVRDAIGLVRSAFIVGHIGRYHEIKDHANLIEAFSLFAREHENSHLVMVGTNVDDSNCELTRLIDRSGFGERIHPLGERDDIPSILNAFNVLVNCSRSEAFPNVLGEAMACGIPCIATDVGDSSLILGPNGFTVPPRDPLALADALMRYINLPSTHRSQLSHDARDRIMTNFGLEKVAKTYERLYMSLT